MGRVVSPAIGPVSGAQVLASGPTLQGVRVATSRPDGFFQLLALPPGTYTIRITAIGTRPVVMRDVAVRLGSTTTLGDLVLETQTVELSEIVVTGHVFGIDPSSPALGANVGAADYEAKHGGSWKMGSWTSGASNSARSGIT